MIQNTVVLKNTPHVLFDRVGPFIGKRRPIVEKSGNTYVRTVNLCDIDGIRIDSPFDRGTYTDFVALSAWARMPTDLSFEDVYLLADDMKLVYEKFGIIYEEAWATITCGGSSKLPVRCRWITPPRNADAPVQMKVFFKTARPVPVIYRWFQDTGCAIEIFYRDTTTKEVVEVFCPQTCEGNITNVTGGNNAE